MKQDKKKKRKLELDSDEKDVPEEKIQKTSISAAELRAAFKERTPIKVLKEFMHCEKKSERIGEYIQAGGSVSELLVLLNDFDLKKNVSPAIPVFQSLKLFIAKCLSEYPALKKKLIEECRQLLSIHLTTLISMLSNIQTPRDRKASLELLTVLISCHETLAWEVLSKCHFPVQELQSLTFKKKYTDNTSVRDSFIPFLVSFLVDQPPNIVLKFLHCKGLLTSLFPGLVNDSFQLVLVILETLRVRIVENKDVNKTLKLNIFNTTSMCHLLSVYNWDPTFGATELGRVNEDDKTTVKNYLHTLMVLLLTSEKQGVLFADPSFGLSGKVLNELVVNMIKQARPPWKDPMTEDLFIKMIAASPDLAKPFYKHIEQIFSTSSLEQWCNIINFISSLIGTVDLNVNNLDAHTKFRLMSQIYLPHFIILSLVSKIKEGSHEEMLCATRCLSVCLKEIASKCSFVGFFSRYLMFTINNIAEFIITNIEKCTSNFEIDGIHNSLDCLLKGYKLCPQLLDSIRFNMNSKEIILSCIRQIKKVYLSSQEKDIKHNLCCLKSIQLCEIIWPLEHTNADFGFWLEDLAHFITNDEEVLAIGLEVLKSLFMETSLFEGSFEINLWLHSFSVFCNQAVGSLLLKSIRYAQKHLITIYKELSEAGADGSETESAQQMDLEAYMKAALLTYNDDIPTDFNITFTPSPLLVALLKVISKETIYGQCNFFVQELLTNVCHHCSSPNSFLSLLNRYANHKSISPVVKYLESLLNGIAVLPECVSPLFEKFSVSLIADKATDVSAEIDSQLVATLLGSQCLFYLCCGAVSPKRASFVISRIVARFPELAPTLLSRPFLSQKFSPLSDPNSPTTSNFVVLALCETGNPRLPLEKFAQKLSFLIRCAVTKKSTLKKVVGIGRTLKLLSLPKSEVQNIIDNCLPLPKRCLKRASKWFEIVAYALEEALVHKIFISPDLFVSLLNQFAEYFNEKMNYRDISSSLGKFMAKTYKDTPWSVKQVKHLKHILSMLCYSNEWCPELSTEIYKNVDTFDTSPISLERALRLLASQKSSSAYDTKSIGVILSTKHKEIMKELMCEPMPVWLDDLIKILKEPEVSSSNLSKLFSCLEKNLDGISLCVDNLKLFYTACFFGNKPDLLLKLLHNYLAQLKSYENVELLKLVGGILCWILNVSSGKLEYNACRTSIMVGLKIPELLVSLTTAVKCNKALMEPKEMFALATSHSLFLEALIDNKFNSKEGLVCLLTVCVKADKSVMKSSHIPVYLSSYHASLSAEDQALVRLMKVYEEGGINFKEWKPIVWGQLAVQKYSIREVKRRVNISLSPTIDLLDLATVNRTITKFPFDRSVSDSDSDLEAYESGLEIYDPVFILAALSQSVGAGSDVPPRKVVLSGVIALALASLNSNCYIVRAMGYHLIHSFYQSLADRRFDDVFMSFVEILQRSIINRETCPKLNGVLSVFLARASLIMTEPLHPLYPLIHNFTMAVQSFRLDSVPAFLELFHTTSPARTASVKFILEVIRDGVRSPNELQVLLNAGTLKILLVYYGSTMATGTARRLIDQILANTLRKADFKQCFLTKEYSIMPWLSYNKRLDIAFKNIRNIRKFYFMM